LKGKDILETILELLFIEKEKQMKDIVQIQLNPSLIVYFFLFFSSYSLSLPFLKENELKLDVICVIDANVADPESPDDQNDTFTCSVVTKEGVPNFGPKVLSG